LLARLVWPLLERLVADKVRARFGGRLRVAVAGGAPMNETISRTFLGLGLPVVQGYGLTETAPVVSGNRPDNNFPASVGEPFPGVEVRLGENDELLVRAPCVMLGYWNRPEATRAAIDPEGWLHTGDQARLADGRIYICGRIKDIIVTSSGEKVPPADLEMAIGEDPLFEQVMVLGEGRPCLGALVVLNREAWRGVATGIGCDPDDPAALAARATQKTLLARINARLAAFPAYARVRAARFMLEPWSIEAGLLTPTLKLKRPEMEKRFAAQIEQMFREYE